MNNQSTETDHDDWCPVNGCRCGKCGPCMGPPLCVPATEKDYTPAPCGSAEHHTAHWMPCDSGCQPDWHKDGCAIYDKCPGITFSPGQETANG